MLLLLPILLMPTRLLMWLRPSRLPTDAAKAAADAAEAAAEYAAEDDEMPAM